MSRPGFQRGRLSERRCVSFHCDQLGEGEA